MLTYTIIDEVKKRSNKLKNELTEAINQDL